MTSNSFPTARVARVMPLHIEANTLDDLMRGTIDQLLHHGERASDVPERGSNLEALGARLQLNDPRARLSRTETRRRTVSAIGELAWYLSGSDSVDQIGHWIEQYRLEAESDGRVHGAYGPRLFGSGVDAQFDRTIQSLREKPGTRRAVMQIFDRNDTFGERKKDIPCTCTLQLLQREGQLHMISSMRSNDAILGLPHDIFAFTMLQEIAATELGLELGQYIHQAASIHIYDKNRDLAEGFLREGWQSNSATMPPMSGGPQAVNIQQFLVAESQLRAGKPYSEIDLPMDPYWADLARLLALGSAKRLASSAIADGVAGDLHCQEFREFVRAGALS